eukprot:713544_1
MNTKHCSIMSHNIRQYLVDNAVVRRSDCGMAMIVVLLSRHCSWYYGGIITIEAGLPTCVFLDPRNSAITGGICRIIPRYGWPCSVFIMDGLFGYELFRM